VSSMRSIKQRIGNISSVEQIIRAMDMVASTKLVQARAKLEGVRPIYNELKRIVEEVGTHEKAMTHIFYEQRKVENSLYIILTSNRGLAGGYNSNICKKTLEHMNQGKNEKLIVAGSKGYEFFRNYDKSIVHSIVGVSNENVYYGSENLAKKSIELYLTGAVEEVFIACTRFENVLTHEPTIEKVLPIQTSKQKDMGIDDRKYEPSLEVFIDAMVPLYMHMNLFRAFSEAHTSEQAARRVNMDAAGKNASEIIQDLNRLYNRKRQAAITQEISEIVGSAGVLSKGGLND